MTLTDFNFRKTKFQNCNFKNTTVEKSNFTKAIFRENNLENCQFIDCAFSNFESNLQSFKNCTFKNVDLRELKDLSKFKGIKFDSCLFNFADFTYKVIENIQFQNINLQTQQDFQTFIFTNVLFKNTSFENVKINPQYFGVLSLILDNFDNSISSELYSHTNSKSIPQLLYRGSRDGFNSNKFHSKCDNQGPTLTIIKSEHNQVFGAFTSQSWQSSTEGYYISDPSAFIFKICQNSANQNYQFLKFKITKKEYAIYSSFKYLIAFGGGFDICITNGCDLNNSYSNFGNSFELPNEYQQKNFFQNYDAKTCLAGSSTFKVSEIEVWKIKNTY